MNLNENALFKLRGRSCKRGENAKRFQRKASALHNSLGTPLSSHIPQ